jgi:hypothetical protein
MQIVHLKYRKLDKIVKLPRLIDNSKKGKDYGLI